MLIASAPPLAWLEAWLDGAKVAGTLVRSAYEPEVATADSPDTCPAVCVCEAAA
jgi:hypothetical protein